MSCDFRDIGLEYALGPMCSDHAEGLELERWNALVIDAMTGNRLPHSILASAESLVPILVEFGAVDRLRLAFVNG